MAKIDFFNEPLSALAIYFPSYIQEEDSEEDLEPIITTEYQKKRIEKRIEFYQKMFEEGRNFKPQSNNPILDKLVEISCGDPLRINRALDQIAQLSKQLRRCKLVDIPNNSQEVSISTSVRIEDLTYKETRTINIVGNGIFYPDRAELPCSSSLAKKLIGTKVNETKKVTSQERTIEYRILAISPYNPQE